MESKVLCTHAITVRATRIRSASLLCDAERRYDASYASYVLTGLSHVPLQNRPLSALSPRGSDDILDALCLKGLCCFAAPDSMKNRFCNDRPYPAFSALEEVAMTLQLHYIIFIGTAQPIKPHQGWDAHPRFLPISLTHPVEPEGNTHP